MSQKHPPTHTLEKEGKPVICDNVGKPGGRHANKTCQAQKGKFVKILFAGENSGKLTQRLGGRYWAESIRFPECSTNRLWTAKNCMVTMANYITGHKIDIFTNGNSYTFSQMVTLRHVYVNWFDCGNFLQCIYFKHLCTVNILLKFSTNMILLDEKCA